MSNNTNFSDAQIAAFTLAAEAMKENGMDYWPSKLLGLPECFTLLCVMDDSIWLVDLTHSWRNEFSDESIRVQKILG